MPELSDRVGEVVEASTANFIAQCYELYEMPPLGSLVKTGDIYGVVSNAATSGLEPGRRPIALGKNESSEDAIFKSNPQLTRLFKSEFGVVVVGHRRDDKLYQYLPPVPAKIHSFVYRCQAEEIKSFRPPFGFLGIMLSAELPIPVEELIAAVLRRMSAVQEDPHKFLIAAGKELSILLSGQYNRLRAVLGEAAVNERLGMVVAGSLEKGVEVRLDGGVSVEDMAVGRYVTIEGQRRRFLGMITDVSLGVTDPQLALTPPAASDTFLTEVLAGTGTYGSIHVTPYLMLGGSAANIVGEADPVKTVPTHFAAVNLASEADMELVFGKEDKKRFWIGNPLDMETRLCLNLEEFVKRSNGIFGKSGTGKTFLTRILLIGMLQKSRAVNLIFDMHNEYGWSGTSEGGKSVKGLKQLFPAKVAVFTLDEENSRHRGVSTDFVVNIGYDEIEPGDIALLRQTLNLTELAAEAVHSLRRHFGKNWLQASLDLEESEATAELLEHLNIHESSFQNLRRGLQTIARLPFVVSKAKDNTVARILSCLDEGKNVVLEFGRYRDITAYILVANMLSRRIYSQYQERTERSMGDEKIAKPIPLVITIEEAHKFLNPEVAGKTIFGTIAREMRKYNVSLLVIDQRPSGIDEEVMSQIGTKITYLLDNEHDVDSILAGVSGKSALKSVLARLAPRQQALIFGHAVPMPVTFQPREYGSAQSYKAFASEQSSPAEPKDIEELWK